MSSHQDAQRWFKKHTRWWTRIELGESQSKISSEFMMCQWTLSSWRIAKPVSRSWLISLATLRVLKVTRMESFLRRSSTTITPTWPCVHPLMNTSSAWWSQPGSSLKRRIVLQPNRQSVIFLRRSRVAFLSWLAVSRPYLRKSLAISIWIKAGISPLTRWLTWSLSSRSLWNADMSIRSSSA